MTGTCPECGRVVPLRKNGTLRVHRVYLPQREQDPSTHLGRTKICEGAGKAAA